MLKPDKQQSYLTLFHHQIHLFLRILKLLLRLLKFRDHVASRFIVESELLDLRQELIILFLIFLRGLLKESGALADDFTLLSCEWITQLKLFVPLQIS